MYRRDYFLKLVQQFSRMVAKLIGLKEAGEIDKAKELIEDAYKEFFNELGSVLKSIPIDSLTESLKVKHGLSEEQMEILSKLFFEEADLYPEDRIDLLLKSLNILEYLNREQKIYSFDREAFIKKIKSMIG